MSREGKEWGEAVQYRHVELTAGTDRRRCRWSNSEMESLVWMGVSWCWGKSRARLVPEVFSRIASCVAFAWALFWKSELVPMRILVQAHVSSCREATPVNSRKTVQMKGNHTKG